MKTFITNLLSNSNDVSHKRLIALISFLVLIVMVIIKAFGYQLDNTLIYVFASMAGGESVLTVIEKFNK